MRNIETQEMTPGMEVEYDRGMTWAADLATGRRVDVRDVERFVVVAIAPAKESYYRIHPEAGERVEVTVASAREVARWIAAGRPTGMRARGRLSSRSLWLRVGHPVKVLGHVEV